MRGSRNITLSNIVRHKKLYKSYGHVKNRSYARLRNKPLNKLTEKEFEYVVETLLHAKPR